MIISYIQGGLGNQLFQIAAGLSLARDIGCEFRLIRNQHHLPLQGTRIENYYNNIFKNIKFIEAEDVVNFKIYREPFFSFREIPKIENLILEGYFQSEKYFKHNENYIREVINFPKCETKPNFVSLHLRQGDYANNLKFHYIQKLDYYNQSVSLIKNYDKILAFSDSKFPDEFNFDRLELVTRSNDLDEFSIMSSCQTNIISNSTFSWWAAWANENKNKRVLAPRTWFGPQGPQDWQDIYCEGWEVI